MERGFCTPHRISENDLKTAVLADIKEWAKLVLADETAVLEMVMEQTKPHNTVDYKAVGEKKRSCKKCLEEIERSSADFMKIMY